ncbi:GIY-YIG nuclease family protein [Candidatus Woesebacteria bacterium]|nr:GIY-YIG nuclease family protein [Candidatus Woesebacteria bacterium]
MACVYILQSEKNQRFYIGSTIDLKRRFQEHCEGRNTSTRNILPVKLIFSQEYSTLHEARKVELWLKRMKSRVLIDKIIQKGIIDHTS